MLRNEFNNANDILYYTLKQIINYGEIVSPRSSKTKEILAFSFILNNPRARCITLKSRKWKVDYALGELIWNLKGSKDVNEIAFYSSAWLNFSEDSITINGSCYGSKIYGNKDSDTLNYWELIVKLLKEDPDSRRAILYIGNSNYFGLDQPCINSIQFLLRGGKLNCICNMRSNDIIWGTCYDLFLVTFLQEMMAVELNVDLGWYMHQASSMHLYERHYEMAHTIINEYESSSDFRNFEMSKMTVNNEIDNIFKFEEEYRINNKISNDILESLDNYWNGICKALISGDINDL